MVKDLGASAVSVEKTEVVNGPVKKLRPFYFIVVCWGERFLDYLTEFCLPSLLAPGNIPALRKEGGHKFLFCTTSDDWRALTKVPIFSLLQRSIEPCFIEIPPAPADKVGCEHMGIGHKLAAQLAHRDKAYGVFLAPDLMVSEGTVRALQKHARAGCKVVLVAALRCGEEPLFEYLRRKGVIREGERRSELGQPLILSGRQMVAAGLCNFHSETQRYEWETPYFTNFPYACWWKVPGEEGIVLHSLSWAPFLCDYSAVEQHDTSALDTWTIDGDYVHRNFGHGPGVYVVTDSDEMMLISWGPLSDRPQDLKPGLLKRLPMVGDVIKGSILRAVMVSGVCDSLKQRIFFIPIRWHSRELTAGWKETESKAAEVFHRYLWDLEPSCANERGEHSPTDKVAVSGKSGRGIYRLLFGPLVAAGRVWIAITHLYHYRDRLRMRLRIALRGDREAWIRIFRRIGTVWKLIRGVPQGHL